MRRFKPVSLSRPFTSMGSFIRDNRLDSTQAKLRALRRHCNSAHNGQIESTCNACRELEAKLSVRNPAF